MSTHDPRDQRHPVADLLGVIEDPEFRETMNEAMQHAYRLGVASARKFPQVTIDLWQCPICEGTGRADSGSCIHCGGAGLTNDVAGWDPAELKPAPRPPAAMARPCTDCAFRPGSPESDALTLTLPGPEAPFFCHHGLHRVGDAYVSPAMMGELPLGAMLCAGWWDTVTGTGRPTRPFRDPGGADRHPDTPRTPGSR